MTFTWGRCSVWSTRLWAREPGCASVAPSAKLAPTTGMLSGVWFTPKSVPVTRPERRSVLPWLKMMTAEAPASCALIALTPNSQVPRWMSAMAPTGNPAKSLSSQPLVTGSRGGARTMSTGTTFAVTSPYPVPVKIPLPYSAETGATCSSRGGGTNVKSNGSSSTFQPAASRVSTTYSTLSV